MFEREGQIRGPQLPRPERASTQDREAILDLLERSGLPTAGLSEHVADVAVVRDGGRVVGVAALERYADGALLRSVAVDESLRGAGLGHRLTEDAIERARQLGVPTVYLLTTTAENFFSKFGFEQITRDEVPASVRASVEFTSACPASAVVMRRTLTQDPTTVLFACVHNAGRSQIAAALFNLEADPTRARAISAGTQPGPRVHPEVLRAMQELGVDLSGVQPQRLTDELASQAQVLITMGCGDACPVVPGTIRDDWPLEDPNGRPLARVREIREEIRARVRELIQRSGWARSGGMAGER
jgi:arsenate reductase